MSVSSQPSERLEWLLAYVHDERTIEEIGLDFHRSTTTIGRGLRRMNAPMRPKGERAGRARRIQAGKAPPEGPSTPTFPRLRARATRRGHRRRGGWS